MEEIIPTDPARLRYLLAEGFIVQDGDTYKFLTSDEQRQIISNIRKNGFKDKNQKVS